MGGPGFCNNKTYNCFDNFYPCVFMVDGKKYTSSEQCYQALKFEDEDWKEKIRSNHNPNTCWFMGQSRNHKLIPDFEEKKSQLMYIANFAKFIQNKYIADILMDTNGIITFNGSTPFWNNENADILMRIRTMLQQQKFNMDNR